MITVPWLAFVAAFLWGLRIYDSLRDQRAEDVALRARLVAAEAAAAELDALRVQLRGLRHDVRGILSPALLVSDRLLNHGEPHVKRAGEVMIRTVERAVARLAETRLDQEPTSAQL